MNAHWQVMGKQKQCHTYKISVTGREPRSIFLTNSQMIFFHSKLREGLQAHVRVFLIQMHFQHTYKCAEPKAFWNASFIINSFLSTSFTPLGIQIKTSRVSKYGDFLVSSQNECQYSTVCFPSHEPSRYPTLPAAFPSGVFEKLVLLNSQITIAKVRSELWELSLSLSIFRVIRKTSL